MIQSLVEKVDTFEILRDEIAAILALETASQQALATAANKDPKLWKLRVFSERSNPWAEWLGGDDVDMAAIDASPIVSVAWDNSAFPMGGGNVVARQQGTFTYHIDCYGYGQSRNVTAGGHIPGDEDAARNCQRAVRLVRNFIMAGENTYLQHRGLVGRRWIQSINSFQPAMGDTPIQNVHGVRITLEVTANEFSPQYEGEPLELISMQVKRAGTGEIYVAADFDHPADS